MIDFNFYKALVNPPRSHLFPSPLRPFLRLLLASPLLLFPLYPQQPAELERRISALEQKMRQLDPTFDTYPQPLELSARLDALEKKLDALLAKQKPASAEPAPSPSASPGTRQLEVKAAQVAPQAQRGEPQPPGPALSPVLVSGDYQSSPEGETRLPVAGYMDFHVNRDSGDAFRPDFHRFVLLFGHSFNERLKFWSELELEHALVEGGGEETGELALEQAYIDFLIKSYFNLRGGLLLAPVGIINERHEPPSFNGVERPFVETFIIPSTWRELGFGFTGDLGRGFRYRAYLTSSLNASGLSAEEGIRGARTSGFNASLRNPAKVVRLEFVGVRRLTLGASFYSGHAGFETTGLNPRITIAELDGRYSWRRLDFRGLFADTWISRAAELNRRLQQQFGSNPNIARQLRGYYFEPALHLLARRSRHDLIVFTRYEKYDTQRRMPEGFVPLPQFNRSSWLAGVTYKPNADVAFKFDYVWNRNASAVVQAVNGINLGIGWWF